MSKRHVFFFYLVQFESVELNKDINDNVINKNIANILVSCVLDLTKYILLLLYVNGKNLNNNFCN